MLRLYRIAIDGFNDNKAASELLLTWSDVYNRIGISGGYILVHTVEPNHTFTFVYDWRTDIEYTSDEDCYARIPIEQGYSSLAQAFSKADGIDSVDFRYSGITLTDPNSLWETFIGLDTLTDIIGLNTILGESSIQYFWGYTFQGTGIKTFDGVNPTLSNTLRFIKTFKDCKSLETADLRSLYTGGVGRDRDAFGEVFDGCSALTTVRIGYLRANKYSIFHGCSSLQDLFIEKLDTTLYLNIDGVKRLSDASLVSVMGNTVVYDGDDQSGSIYFHADQIADILSRKVYDVKAAYVTARRNGWFINYDYGRVIKGTTSTPNYTMTLFDASSGTTFHVTSDGEGKFEFAMNDMTDLHSLFSVDSPTKSEITSVDFSDSDITMTKDMSDALKELANVTSVTFGSEITNYPYNLTDGSGLFDGVGLGNIQFGYELPHCIDASRMFADNSNLVSVAVPSLPSGANTTDMFLGSGGVRNLTLTMGNKASLDLSMMTITSQSIDSVLISCANTYVYDGATIRFSDANISDIDSSEYLSSLRSQAIAHGWNFSEVVDYYFNANDGKFYNNTDGRIIITG